MKKFPFKIAVAIFLVTLISILAVSDLFKPGYFESHDGVIHLMRLTHFDEALKSGQFPMRFIASANAGYGSMVVNYNWSLPYYAASLIHLFHFSLQDSLKIVLILSGILSAVFCFYFLHSLTDDLTASVVGSIFYVWAPYRFINIFIRGAVGEAVSFIFLPLVFYCALKAARTEKIWWFFIETVSWILLISSHNLIALVTAGFYILFLIFVTFVYKKSWKFFTWGLVSFILAVGITAYFWLPASVETSLIKYDQGYGELSKQFLTPNLLWQGEWKYSYALPDHPHFSMSFQFGNVHLLVITLYLPVLLFSFIKGKKSSENHVISISLFFLWMILVSFFLSLGWSRPLYEYFTKSVIFGFPWRFLTFATFGTSVISAVVITKIPRLKILAAVFLIVAVIISYKEFARVVSWRLFIPDEEYASMVKTNINFLPDSEFLPKRSDYLQLVTQRGKAQEHSFFETIEKGQFITLLVNKHEDLRYEAAITAEEKTDIRAQVFAFPNWQLFIDGIKTPIDIDQYGLVKFTLSPGTHRVELKFINTSIESVANGISLVSVGMGIVFLVIQIRRRRNLI